MSDLRPPPRRVHVELALLDEPEQWELDLLLRLARAILADQSQANDATLEED